MKRLCMWLIVMLVAGLIPPGIAVAQDGGENLVFNGDFGVRHNGWEPVIGSDCAQCTLEIQHDVSSSTGFILAWGRANSGNSGNAAYARQVIDHDVSGYDSLVLDLSFMVMHHSLTNSGWWSDEHGGSGEYPVKVTLRFYDAQENLFEWSHGFLATHDGSTAITNYTVVTPGEWIDFQRDLFAPENWVDPRGAPLPEPVSLHDVMVGGYGWNFGGALRFIAVVGYGAGADDGDGSGGGATMGGGQLGGGQSGFIVEEYPLVSAEQDAPTHFEFRDYVSSAVLDVRRMWREPAPQIRLDVINPVIGAWGYELVLNPTATAYPTYTLMAGGSPLIPDVGTIWPLAANASGTAFQLLVDSQSQALLVVTQDTVGRFDTTGFVYIPPVYVGDELVEVVGNWEAAQFHVVRAGETIYTVTPDGPFVEPPTKALWAWDGKWVLEVEGDIIIDGESLNAQMGYSESFGWRLIAGQPFYFFRQGEQLAMSYAGQTVEPYRYDAVVHYRCCEESMFNLQGNSSMVWFYALKDGIWHYVEAGIYD